MKVENRDKRIWNVADRVRLLPGVNEVDEKIWDLPEVSASASNLVQAGLVVLDRKVSVKDLSAFQPAEAIGIVKGTVDRALLEQWSGVEKRQAVTQAIQAQIAAITPDSKKSKDDEDDDAPAPRKR